MSNSQPGSNVFSVRIVSIDHYMAPPISGYDICYSSFQGEKVNEVPIIRIYGSTPAGQKTCLHIHRALPYLYVLFTDILPQGSHTRQGDDACTHALALALEKALKLKGSAGSKRQHVYGCSLVRAKKFYGYHSSEELFVKIYLYYPHDVSRAANLLLAGAILDKSMQPHESHIPFILQFLVDYNLYGMGHIHLSRMKFRNPVPDVPNPRKFDYCGQHGQMDDMILDSAGFQADSSVSSPVWVSSTIPGEWMWHVSNELELSSDQDIYNIRRQSVCELEGDTTIDDILNQQFKIYTSLSQTSSDVKMVQSLIPIWEEESERTGKHETALPSDSDRPHSEDVLKALSLGLGFENILMESCSKVEETVSCNELVYEHSVMASADEENLVGPILINSKHTVPQALRCLKEQNLLGPLSQHCKPCEKEIRASLSEEKDVCPELLSIGEVQSSETVLTSDTKATDTEALGLLRWLATSHAGEDINSDDELIRESILTPLLPETTIDKVLEKASIDYESESQKECQDILDSIGDLIDFEGLKERTPRSFDYAQISSGKNIPQTDGSFDDLSLSPSAEPDANSSKTDIKTQFKRSSQDTGKTFSTKRKRKQSLWGSLPLSVTEKGRDNCDSVSFNVTEACAEVKDDLGASLSAENDLGKTSDPSIRKVHASECDKQEASTLAECSVRDLMRRKRSRQIEPADCGSIGGENVHSKGEKEKPILFCPKQLDFDGLDDELDKKAVGFLNDRPSLAISVGHCETYSAKEFDFRVTSAKPLNSDADTSKSHKEIDFPDERLKQTGADDSCCLSASPFKHKVLGMDGYIHNDYNKSGTSSSAYELAVMDAKGNKSDPQNEDCGGRKYGSNPGLVVDEEAKPVELIGLTLCKKPLTVDWNDGTTENVSISPTTQFCPLFNEGNYQGTSGRASDEILPFFSVDCEEVKGSRDNFLGNNNSDFHQEAALGVPTVYQNDGSFLYLLTPVFSPPSVDSVYKWLSCDDEGSSQCLIVSENSSPVNCNEAFIEASSEYKMRSMLDQGNREKNAVLVSEVKSCCNESRTCQSEGKLAKVNTCSDGSQDMSQISGPDGKSRPTPLSQIGFRDPASVGAGQQLTLLSLEVHTESRGDLRPDPRFDAINVIALAIQNDNDSVTRVYVLLYSNSGSCQRSLDGLSGFKMFVFSEEKHLFGQFVKILCSHDPDILMGWDVQGSSLGFLAERAAYLGIGLLNEISRTPSETKIKAEDANISEKGLEDELLPPPLIADNAVMEDTIIEDEWGRTHASGVHVGGRIVLNVWRLMRSEVKLNMYTAESVAESVLRRKIPSIPYKVLTKWFSSCPARARYRCIEYVVERAKLNLEIMNQLDMINRTSELARVFGIDFFSVLSRGSQFRVESMFLRLAHTQNYLAISPGNQQVAFQPAMECLPLVMEPESGFYADPVVVLDFQSLYPSMIIAYNLCFCTCLGKTSNSKGNALGVSSYTPDPNVLRDLKDQLLLTPNGVMYMPSKVRKGVLPRLLEEILSTRIMVKQSMKKLTPSQQVLQRIFNARQLALKLIANVTYGYTAAGFSGRMPCAELADSIVQCGRSTLENAISYVNSHEKWKANVIYGDTDSMFVLLKGRTVEESFKIGHEIATSITAMNPNPVTLKMEKVHHPCFLLTKKRYVGYSYESPDQVKPIFDAKGIETVRRDTCGAVAKTLEQSLRLFFEHQDISKVKEYLHRQWTRILSGRISLQDFVFAKEVRLGTYSAKVGSLPPAAIVATKAIRADPRAEPRYAERVPYVVIHGEPGARLADMVVDPLELLAINSPYRLNDLYYINKQIIPALQRVFGLVGADLNRWFSEMPRPAREAFGKSTVHALNPQRTRIDYYYLSKHCILCGELVQASAHLCGKCSQNKIATAIAITGRTSKLEREMQHLVAICRQCGGGDWLVERGVKCNSLACSVFYERCKVQKELQGLSAIATEKGETIVQVRSGFGPEFAVQGELSFILFLSLKPFVSLTGLDSDRTRPEIDRESCRWPQQENLKVLTSNIRVYMKYLLIKMLGIQEKKKLADKLGSQWSKAEIERFYKAYREYGKDWKKVAAAVRNRSNEMVEALYSMNRAYLSLPDGTASVIGLIAMMTDHYSVMGGSEGERESNEPSEIPQKAQKRKREKVHPGSSKEDVVQPPSTASSQGCLSLLKRAGLNGIHPHAVRKRTPRVPVSYSYRRNDTESYIPPNKKVKKSEVDDNDDERVAALTLTLTGALERGGSPHVSPTSYKRAERRRSSPVQSYDRMMPQSETTKAKLHDSSHECQMEGRPGGAEPVSGTYARDTGPLMDMEGVGTIEVHRKRKKLYGKKIKVEEIKNNLSDDGGEACSGTEEGIVGSALREKVNMEISSAKNEISPWSQRKRSKKLVFGDESSSLDALLTLANLSTSMLPTSVTESESSVRLKEDITQETDNKCSLPEATSISHHRDKTKHLGPKEMVLNLINGAEDATSRKSKIGRCSATNDNVVSEPKQQPKPTNNSWKRKRKSSNSKISNAEPPMDSHFIQSFDNEDVAEEENKHVTEGKCGAQSSIQSQQLKPFRVPQDSPPNNDQKMGGIDLVVSTSQDPASNPVNLPIKHQSRRKMNLKRALLSTDINSSKCTLKNQPNKHSLSQDRLKEKLSSFLSSKLARRWCTFEWFYSAIDYAWFAKREFVEYLNHVGLGHIPRLTHVEWGVIRSSLGKPRRFSERFLHEERYKLKQYRESVRQHYTQLRTGTREGLATDLARPLSVGQRVIVIHPKTREVSDGKVLTVDHERCRVQFDSPELGVEFVMDIDCMPLDPLENMPEALRRQNLAFDKFSVAPIESQGNGYLDFGGSVVFTSSGHLEKATAPVNMLMNPRKVDANLTFLHAKTAVPNVVSAHQAACGQPLSMAHIQRREADIRAMSELNHALDKKEALPTELRNTNNDILDNRNGKRRLKGSEPFKKHIDTASAALLDLKQHNAYPANPSSNWQKPLNNLNFFDSLTSSVGSSRVSPEAGYVVGEIVKGSRLKAHAMVDAAIKAISSMKEGEDAFTRIGEAIDSVDKKQLTSDIRMPVIKLPEMENGSMDHQKHLVSGTSKPMPTSCAPSPKLQEASVNNVEQVPSELITSCVATLLMIQVNQTTASYLFLYCIRLLITVFF
ncbi:hypothetical protein DITRI_Ditri06bG0165400 [Diplodiscus trichospermus]